MLNNTSKLYPVAVYGIFTGIAYSMKYVDSTATQIISFVSTCVLSACTFVYTVQYISETILSLKIKNQIAKAITPESELADKLSRLSDDAINIYKSIINSDLHIDGSFDGLRESDYIFLDGIPVPSQFVRDLIAKSHGNNLPPLRDYGEGSKERKFYKAVINFLEDRNLVKPAIGNLPAQVTVRWKQIIDTLNSD